MASPAAAAGEEPAPRPIADEELQLLAAYTGETDLVALREHVVALWRRAMSGSAPVYLCVRALMFLEPRIKGHPAYQRALQRMAAARAGGAGAPLWLDVGAAVGTDVRQLRVDGLSREEVVFLDVPDAEHYWNVGLELYKDAGSPPCAALFGDIADDAVLPPAVPAPAVPSAAAPAQAPAQGGSVAELAGRCTVVSCTAVLHCLGREQVEALLRKMAVLLAPGGLLLGSTLGAPTPRAWEATYQAGHTRWLHSAESLAGALAAAGYEGVEVAPTSWRDLDQSISSGTMQPLMEQHVGRGLPLEGKLMLAFSAVKPGGSP